MTGPHVGWEDTLDDLEREAAGLAAHPHEAARTPEPAPWVPPVLEGPPPDVLLDRVRALLRLQAEVEADLSRWIDRTRAELAGLGRTASAAPTAVSAYVDISV